MSSAERVGGPAGAAGGGPVRLPAPQIGVIGASNASERERELAHAVGLELARAGAIVICGGRGGVMEEACRGAQEGGALTVGIFPGADRAQANRWVHVAIPSGMGELRNGLIVRSSEALIAIGGSYGTLSEIALGRRAGRTCVLLESFGELLAEPPLEGSAGGLLRAGDAAEAVALAIAAAG
ncbi:MAG TPA: TIGR00725 family protein [Solirubrobacteraceae bacterium]|nr:TIGR00725 family protein [Solirubrobacteraceae bacterium]